MGEVNLVAVVVVVSMLVVVVITKVPLEGIEKVHWRGLGRYH